MTREEAARILKADDVEWNEIFDSESGLLDEALDIAIKALEQEPCEDCISREAVNDGFKKYEGGSFAYGCVWDYINKLPSVTPKEKMGQWIMGGYDDNYYVCSKCSYIATEYWNKPRYNYCPNCGLRMVEPQESEVDNG